MGFKQSPFPLIEGTTGHKDASPAKKASPAKIEPVTAGLILGGLGKIFGAESSRKQRLEEGHARVGQAYQAFGSKKL